MEFFDKPSPIRAYFYKDVDGKRDLCEIKVVADTLSSHIVKVTPEIAAQFPKDWEDYQNKTQETPTIVDGTPLTEVPGVDRNAAVSLKMHGVRNAEELAGLDEAQARSLGLGGLTFWRAAQNLIKLRHLEAMQAVLDQAPKRGPGRPPKTEEVSN